MEHIGIDLGSRGSHVCVRNADATVQQELRVRTQDLAQWLARRREPSHVVVETCCESFAVADRARACGHQVSVVPAAVVRQLGVGYRGVKNDMRDARVLSRAAIALGPELPTVHVPSAKARQVQRLLAQRSGLVKTRTGLINGIKSQLRAELLSLPSGTSSTVTRRVRQMLNPSQPELLAALEPALAVLDHLQQAVTELERTLEQLTGTDSTVQRLKTVPGVGPITAAAFVAAIDTLERFPDGARLSSYVGLTPGENTTGGKTRLTGITRAGKAQLRTLLIQATWSHVRIAPTSRLTAHYQRLAHGRPKQVAITATARKLTRVLFAMWRDHKPYQPQPHAQQPSTPTEADLQSALSALG